MESFDEYDDLENQYNNQKKMESIEDSIKRSLLLSIDNNENNNGINSINCKNIFYLLSGIFMLCIIGFAVFIIYKQVI